MGKKKHDAPASEARTKRYDRPGHLDPAHAERLLALARERRSQSDDSEFLRANAEDDELASRLGETAVASMTSGDAKLTSELETALADELGGPFVVTSVSDELAHEADATRLRASPRGQVERERCEEPPLGEGFSHLRYPLPRAGTVVLVGRVRSSAPCLARATREPLSGAKVEPHVPDEADGDERGEPRGPVTQNFARIYWPRAGRIARWFGQRLSGSAKALARSVLKRAGHRLRRAS